MNKIHHDLSTDELDRLTLDRIRSSAVQVYVDTRKPNTTLITIECFMVYLKNNGYKIISVDKDHSLLTKENVREVIREGVHAQVSGYQHIDLIDKLMRKLGFYK